MSEADDLQKIKQAYKGGDLTTKALITFTTCARRICESNASPAIKGDALAIAVSYLQSAICTDLCSRFLDMDLSSPEIVIGLNGLEMFDRMKTNHDRLNNIMELFKTNA